MGLLPTKKSSPQFNLNQASVFIHGPNMIGKTSFCAGAQDALFIVTTSGGHTFLDVYAAGVTTWEQFCELCKEIAKGEHAYKLIVIDTIDELYKMCCDHICKKNGVTEH